MDEQLPVRRGYVK